MPVNSITWLTSSSLLPKQNFVFFSECKNKSLYYFLWTMWKVTQGGKILPGARFDPNHKRSAPVGPPVENKKSTFQPHFHFLNFILPYFKALQVGTSYNNGGRNFLVVTQSWLLGRQHQFEIWHGILSFQSSESSISTFLNFAPGKNQVSLLLPLDQVKSQPRLEKVAWVQI